MSEKSARDVDRNSVQHPKMECWPDLINNELDEWNQMELNIEKTHQIDASDKGEDGYYEYYYGYHLYTFTGDGRRIVARQYDDEPEKAAILNFSIQRQREKKWGSPRLFEEIEYEDELLKSAVKYLIEEERVKDVQILVSTGYSAIDLRRLN